VQDTETTALVLAGGGTKGAFEVGVIDHLVTVGHLVPRVITSASAGSVLALVLAQARGAEELAHAVEELRGDLLAMARTDQVFGRQPWLAAFDGTPLGAQIDRLLTVQARPTPPGGNQLPAAEPDAPPARHHMSWRHLTGALEELTVAGSALRELKQNATSLLTLDPLEAALRGHATTGIRPVDLERVARPGLELRMSVTALGAGRTHYVGADGTLYGPEADVPIDDRRATDAIEGAMASSSVPMIFPARRLGEHDGEAYVDGGLLQNIPVEAVAALGAMDVHTVVAVPLQPPPAKLDFLSANMVRVFLRCTAEISFDEVQRRNLEAALPNGARHHVYAPTVDVVGPFEVQQGLMLLDMDYGWLRAQEVSAELDEHDRSTAMTATDSLVVARERAWYLEEQCLDLGAVSKEAEGRLVELKRTVAAATAVRAGLGLEAPPGASSWAHAYEPHDREVPASFPQL
jgi:predicted acylesterase/phospholipase RssA